MRWWEEKRFRMIQNNLRDIDCYMDLDQYVDMLKSFHANVCMVGCGGITSFYPTVLNSQTVSPYLRGDFFGKLLSKCHENGIRVIARFDFSKTNRRLLEKHPEWYTKSIEGNPVFFNDTAATCVNGAYQQEESLNILEEVLRRYQPDGVFFNMFGYQTYDYSNHYTGICQCDNCKQRFKEYSGYELPVKEDLADPVFQKYCEFKKFSTDELLQRIYQMVKSINPDVAVCTYSNRHVDLVRNESNSAVDRPLPFWHMASEANVSVIRGTYDNRFSSNCVINAVDIFYRFMGVSPLLTEIRLAGAMAAGGNLDWCIIGGFETYPDRESAEAVKRIFTFHEKYEELFRNMKSEAKILLVCPYGTGDSMKEYYGMFKILKEAHLLFDVIDGREEEILKEKISRYQLVIFTGQSDISFETAEIIEQHKIRRLAIGTAFAERSELLTKLFGVQIGKKIEPVRGSYLLTEPKAVFSDFDKRDWVYLDRDAYELIPQAELTTYLPYIAASSYGPPERCFGHAYTDRCSAAAIPGVSAYFAWNPATLYYLHGYDDFKRLILDVLADGLLPQSEMEVEAPETIEVFFDRVSEDKHLLQLINYSGCYGNVFRKPYRLPVTVNPCGREVKRIVKLDAESNTVIPVSESIHLESDDIYQAYLIEWKEK